MKLMYSDLEYMVMRDMEDRGYDPLLDVDVILYWERLLS